MEILKKADRKFEFPVEWGLDLQSAAEGEIEYVAPEKPRWSSVGDVRDESLPERLRQLVNADDEAGDLIWHTLSRTMAYASKRIPEIAHSVVDIDNAMKWAKGAFILKAERAEGPAVLVTIADDGPGIPDNEMKEVVQSGRRLDQSKPGTGLGLAIASDLVDVYGGILMLGRSKELGGLAVYLLLPVPGGPKLANSG